MELKKFEQTLKNECGISSKDPVLVGLSGGPDSMCLVSLLHNLNYTIFCAHFNHQIRSQANHDMEFVKSYCDQAKIPLIIGSENVPEYAEENNLSMEESARILRYRFLFKSARENKIRFVAVAHTASDQVETVLMHMLRGAGINGLSGMEPYQLPNFWADDIALIRPILDFWRSDVMNYCNEKEIPYIEDETNKDTKYFRNRLRHDLIPYLSTYNPGIEPALVRMVNSMQDDLEIIDDVVENSWQNVYVNQKDEAVILSRNELLGIKSSGLRRRLLRKGLELLCGSVRDFDYDDFSRAANFVQNPTASYSIQLSNHVEIRLQDEFIILRKQDSDVTVRDFPNILTDEEIVINTGEDISIGNGWRIFCEEVSADEFRKPETNNTACFDASEINMPLILRTVKPGDRFNPFGMGSHYKKLSDFFIDEKIPREARKNYPLLCSGNEIIWIPGYRSANFGRIVSDSERIIRLSVYSSSSVEGFVSSD